MTTATTPSEYSSEQTLFRENQEVTQWIDIITAAPSSETTKREALNSLRHVLDKYLEAPTLLDPYLGKMIPQLGTYCCHDHFDESYALSALYSIAKVRGRKRVASFLPHDISLIRPVLKRLLLTTGNTTETTTDGAWESTYILWLWLGLLSLTPFDRKIVLEESELESLIELAKEHLANAGPIRETAAHCLASWLSRQDMSIYLEAFCNFSKIILEDYAVDQRNTFVTMGVLQTLATILKVGTRDIYKEQLHLWDCIYYPLCYKSTVSNMLLRKLLTKWVFRMGCAHLEPQVAKWRYKRGGRTSLMLNLQQSTGADGQTKTCQEKDSSNDDASADLFEVPDLVEDVMGYLLESLKDNATVVRWPAAKGIGRITDRLPRVCAHDVLDGIIEQLERNRDSDTVWHGSCLALGELARRGLLLPDRLPDVIDPILIPAIQFDVRKGRTSVGSHVRDAACYTYWAFARAYAPGILKPHVTKMGQSLVVASLFDREVNCRRAASAAFQESVGRQGAQNFPNGIEILTTADYFSLGNRTEAYTNIAIKIANFVQYRIPIIHHVSSTKLFHWDEEIRMLASKSLHGLASLDVPYMQNAILPALLAETTNSDLFVRHGAVIGVAEIVLALKDDVPPQLNTELAELVPKLEKLRLYRGRGGEIMRAAVCRYVQCLASVQISLSVKQQVRLLDSVDDNLKHPNEVIQSSAGLALGSLMRSYFPVGETGPSDRLQKRVVSKYVDLLVRSKHPGETRGCALALGSLPKKLLAPSDSVLDDILGCLIRAARVNAKVGLESDAETRRNSIQALVSVSEEVGFDTTSVGLTDCRLQMVFDALLHSLTDYNTDRRGDVGSWIRLAAMTGLEKMIVLARQNHTELSTELITRALGGILKQLCERLDNVRCHAGQCLERLLGAISSYHISVPIGEQLARALRIGEETNWAKARSTFPRVMEAASIGGLFYYIVSGIVTSIGGMSGAVTKEAEEALVAWIRNDDNDGKLADQRTERIAQALLDLFKEFRGRRRVILPLLKTVVSLQSRGLLNVALANPSLQFGTSLLLCLDTETKNCGDVHRLLAAVNVSLGCLSDLNTPELNEAILTFIMGMLSHSYPRVRKFTADNLYVQLLENTSVLPSNENEDEALNLLLEGQWDADFLNQIEFTRLAQEFAKLVSISFVNANNGRPNVITTSLSNQTPTDEFASYASLVNDTQT